MNDEVLAHSYAGLSPGINTTLCFLPRGQKYITIRCRLLLGAGLSPCPMEYLIPYSLSPPYSRQPCIKHYNKKATPAATIPNTNPPFLTAAALPAYCVG